jgi:PAS domain S-box-containing protein
MGRRMRALDWTATPLGSPEHWPQSLKTIVRVMLDSRYAMWMLWGPQLTFFCNDAYLPTLGIKREWALGARSDKVWEEIWPDIGPRIAQVLDHGRATWDEGLLLFLERRGFTEETYHTFSYSPVYDDLSRIAGMLCVVTEVTEKVIGERRLKVLRDLAARPAGSTTVEDACKRLLAVLADDPLDVPFASLYLLDPSQERLRLAGSHGELTDALRPAEIALLEGSSPWPAETVLRTAAPRTIELPVGVEPIRGPLWPDPIGLAMVLPVHGSGSSSCIAMLVVGVSPRRPLDEDYRAFFDLVAKQFASDIADAQAYEAERRRAEALAEIDRAKTAFFSNVSHEFRTPLTLMLGPVEEAIRSPATPSPVRTQLELAHRNGLRLLKLVNSLLDFSRIEAGRVQASYEPTDLSALTIDLASTFRSAMERAGLQLEVDCPPLEEPIHVDREMWEKIVLNLLSNAFKFTLSGTIAVRLGRQGGEAVLEVADTGVGIPEHELPRVFERFHRVEGTAGRTQEGSGIGLALVHELVKLHGGTIDAASQLGVGTRFRVRLPFGTAHLPSERIKAPRTMSSTAMGAQPFIQEALRWIAPSVEETSTRAGALIESPSIAVADQRFLRTMGARILLADDNADMRAYVTALLAPMYAVESVVDGAEALAAARRRPPDLILSDIMMPRLDGLGLLKALRSDVRLRDIPVILLSARAGEEARVEGFDAGADDYLIKPFSARELSARVGALLELTSMRRESEQALREREGQLRLATEAAEIGLWDLDMITGTLYWPPRVKAMFGISPEVPVSMADFYAGLHPADRERTSEAFAAALDPNRRELYDVEYRTVGKEDGLIRWVAAKGRAIFDSSGRCVRVIGTAIDITARKQIEDHVASLAREREQLLEAERAARAEAEAANHLKDEFLATVSHELRTPLSTVVSWSRVLQKKFETADPQLQRGLSVIVDNARLQAQIISDLLDMSRIVSGKIQLELAPADLGQLVESAVEAQRPSAEAKRIDLSVASDGEPLIAEVDATRLQQVLWNLLSNAIKFTPEDGRVCIHMRQAGEWAELVVRDTGIGIPARFLPHVFDRFRQADGSTGRRFGGLGLGLAIVKQLVELHGGSVRASSEGEGRGSTFTVRLPLATGLPDERAARAGDAEPVAGHTLGGLRILAVEDDAAMLEVLTRILTEYGASVVGVASAAAALEALSGPCRFDLLMSDIGLPGMDGYELMRSVRKRLSADELPAIAVTAFSREQDRALAAEVGFQAYLTKPYDVARIVGLARKLAQG